MKGELLRIRFQGWMCLATLLAASAAVPVCAQEPAGKPYSEVVLAEDGLIAYWRMDGDAKDAKGLLNGEIKGGGAEGAFVPGAGKEGKSIALTDGRFVTVGAAPQLDIPEITVEMIFLIKFSSPSYDACLFAKRSSHDDTRFSVHVLRNLSGLAFWNGKAVANFKFGDGDLQKGRWYHLMAAMSASGDVKVFLDGKECVANKRVTINADAKELPFQIGASTAEGNENLGGLVREVAVYKRALVAADAARHFKAANLSASAAAATGAAVPAADLQPSFVPSPTKEIHDKYTKAIQGEDSLIAYWPMNGDLKDVKGQAEGQPKNGDPKFMDGPTGGKAVVLDEKRFFTMGETPQLDTSEITVELFFRLNRPITTKYHPCLFAKRKDSPNTRFSFHLWNDMNEIAVWNGKNLNRAELPDRPLRPGQWYHLMMAISGADLQVFLDGAKCDITGTLNTALTGAPFQIGVSELSGTEKLDCSVSEVAVYKKMLKAEDVARHLDAAGWSERLKKMADAKKKLEEEQAKTQAEAQRGREEKLAARMNDPRLFAIGAPDIHRDANLTAIAMPVGATGGGNIQMNGKGEREIWQIFNNYQSVTVPDSFFAIRAKAGDGSAVVRALQASAVGPFKEMKSLTFRGEYPFGWYEFEDGDLPVRVKLEVFSPFIPMKAKESAIPCAIFNYTVENTSGKDVEVSLLATQQNAVGYAQTKGKNTIDGRAFPGYGGNRNKIVSESGATYLHMTSDKDKSAPGAGDMALAFLGDGATGAASWSDLNAMSESFTKDGAVKDGGQAGPSDSGQTIDGALSVPFKLKAGEKRTVPFILTWYFPNVDHGWGHKGNMYTNWWSDALDAAKYLKANIKTLSDETRLFHDTYYQTNLPWWLRDRMVSQMAILRSMTCFWAKDGYFGGWEGCNSGGGCCAGSCTHVWQYAQGHARLFPELGRIMREATYDCQFPDGGLPHRHPKNNPAFDGQTGDIMGAYREYLCSADRQWLDKMWPRVKKAMEYVTTKWDADEDGVLAGPQWNTLDANLGGSSSWLGTMYLGALQATEKMALIEGDADMAKRCARIRESGAKKQNETLWNGEYYIQIPDAKPCRDYNDGVAIDMFLGEWWANQVNLAPSYPLDRKQSGLKALIKYNFRTDFKGIKQLPRKFVDDSDAALQMIQWPAGKKRPANHILYADEAMTGFEYSAAAAMVQSGLMREGFMVTLAVYDRYDGRKRSGLNGASWGYSGNPFGDDECGKYYARAMSVWSLLLVTQGFIYDGPTGVIGFKPVWKPEDHASFFTGAEGWGLYTQKRDGAVTNGKLDLRFGKLRLTKWIFAADEKVAPTKVKVTLGDKALSAKLEVKGGEAAIVFEQPLALEAGQVLSVEIR